MRVLGMMSGTSIDGIDSALVEFARDREDPSIGRARLLDLTEQPWDASLRAELLGCLEPAEVTVGTWCRLHALTGQAFGDAVAAALAPLRARDGEADLVVSHGQTLHHWVRPDGSVGGTLQIGDPARIAERSGLPVLSDLRAADIAAGGQGAPLVPLLDALVWGDDGAVVLNIGGIANASVVGAGEVRAGDTGPGNALLDAAVLAASGGAEHIDRDGALARAGHVHAPLLTALLSDPYYARPFPRSTGREHFNARYAAERAAAAGIDLAAVPLADLAATLTELTAVSITRGITELLDGVPAAQRPRRVIGSGGGMRNPVLRARLAELLAPLALLDSEQAGLPGDAKEAVAMALIGWLSAQDLPGTLPRADGTAITGAQRSCVLGSWTPAPGCPRPIWPSDPVPVRRLIIEDATASVAPAPDDDLEVP